MSFSKPAYFIVDKSGSMGGDRIQNSINFIKKTKKAYDSCKIFAFDRGVTEVNNEDQLKAGGGTSICGALSYVFGKIEQSNYDLNACFFISDAEDSVSDSNKDKFKKQWNEISQKNGIIGSVFLVGNGDASKALQEIFDSKEVSNEECKELMEQVATIVTESKQMSRSIEQLSSTLSKIDAKSDKCDKELTQCNDEIDQLQGKSEQLQTKLATVREKLDKIKDKSEEVKKSAAVVKTEKQFRECQDEVDKLEEKVDEEMEKAQSIGEKAADWAKKAQEENAKLIQKQLEILEQQKMLIQKGVDYQKVSKQIRELSKKARNSRMTGIASQTAELRKQKGEIYSAMRKMTKNNDRLKLKMKQIKGNIELLEKKLKKAKNGSDEMVKKLEKQYEELGAIVDEAAKNVTD